MAINWTQVWAQALSTAFIVPVSTVTTFLVMRYFPKFWEQLEKRVKGIVVVNGDKQKKDNKV
jgi:hypothetical protein